MDTTNYSAARANLAGLMTRVCEDHEPMIITRNGEQSVVMLSLEDYKSLKETAYLLRNPSNARRLLASIGQLQAGKGVERELLE
jgi:antitoxin YefM